MSKLAKKQSSAFIKSRYARNRPLGRQTKGDRSDLPRASTKQARLIELLRSPKGTTIETMMKACGWQQHSVRGFLAGVVRKRLKLKISSELLDGDRIYRIVPTIRSGSQKPRVKQS